MVAVFSGENQITQRFIVGANSATVMFVSDQLITGYLYFSALLFRVFPQNHLLTLSTDRDSNCFTQLAIATVPETGPAKMEHVYAIRAIHQTIAPPQSGTLKAHF